MSLEDNLKGDFRNCLHLIWRNLGFPKPTRMQYDMADYLQRGSDKDMLEAFRGIGKTWVTAAFIVWSLYKNPDVKVLIVSASKAHADKTSAFCLQIIRVVPELQHLAPRGDQADSKVNFTVGPSTPSRDPSVTSLGITGQLTGSRADIILADDIETAQNSQTQMMREKLRTQTSEFGAIIKPGGRTIYLGTPQCEDSIYRDLPSKGYSIRIWPARYPSKKLQDAYNECLAPTLVADLVKDPSLVGKPTEPERFTEEVLLSKEAEYARSGFALQFMLDTTLSDQDRYPLKLQDLIVMDLNSELGPQKLVWGRSPELVIKELPTVGFTGDRFYRPMQIIDAPWLAYTGSVLAIDPSGRGKDETGYAVVKILNGQLFLLEWGGLAGGYEDKVLKTLSEVFKRQKCNAVIIEDNFGDGMYAKLLTPHLGCVPEGIHHSTQKERRIIDTLEPIMNSHKLIVDQKCILMDWKTVQSLPAEHQTSYMGLHQLTRITKDRGSLRHDDRLDALAMAVAYWVEHMARDTDSAVDEAHEAWLSAQVESFLEHCLPEEASGGEKTWLN